MKKFVHIASITKAHGIKGAFSLYLDSDKETILDTDMLVRLTPLSEQSSLSKDGEFFKISSISIGNKGIISFDKIIDRTQAELLLPFAIEVSRDQFPETENNVYYVADLLGLSVIDASTKERIGLVDDYYENGAQVVLKILLSTGLFLELPFIDSFFPNVDIQLGQIEMNVPEMIE